MIYLLTLLSYMYFKNNQALTYLIFILLATGCYSISVTPFFEKLDKFIQTGSSTLDMTPYYNNITADASPVFTFSSTFSNPNLTSFSAISSLQNLNFDISPSGNINITTYICGSQANGIDYCILTMSISRISQLKLRYLALASTFTKITHFYSFGRYYVQNQGSDAYDTANPIINNFGIPAINTATTTRVFVFLEGFNATGSNTTYAFDLQFASSYPSSTILRVQTTSSNNQTIQFSSLAFSILGYNQQDTMSWPFPAARITLGTFTTLSPFSDTNSTFQTWNTFWGLTGLNISGNPVLNFDSTMSTHTSMSASTTSASGAEFVWAGLAFQFKECNTTIPYYLMTQDNCYDLCPDRYYQDNSQMLCQSCTNYDCQKCFANGTCTVCDNITDHRQLNATTGRCDPLAGYFQSGVPVAPPCDSNCLTCTGANTTCTSCIVGNYLSSSTCFPCSTNCTNCTNGSTCITCDSGYLVDANGNCSFGIDCVPITNCATCDQFVGCSVCNAGYNLTNSTLCDTVCGDGIWVGGTQQCDDNNTANGDGCSSTCTLQPAFFCLNTNLSTSSCDACSQYCLNCTSNTSCTLCQSPSVTASNATGQFCSANCSSLPNCALCSISNSTISCDSCMTGYYIINVTCSTVCGDSIVIGSEECDDGNSINGDGCSSNCSIENNFACITVSNTSVCVECVGATYQATNKTVCQPCANYDCGTCDISGNCTLCNASSNRQMDVNTSRCVPLDGFFDDGSSFNAQPCSVTCLTCNGNTTSDCLTCDTNASMVLNGTQCATCADAVSQGCTSCFDNSTGFVCSACAGSTLSGGICHFSPPQLPSSNMLIIILAALGALLLLCCCFLIICCCRRRKKQEQEQQVKNEDTLQQHQQQEEEKKEQIKNDPFDDKLLSINMSKKKYRGDRRNPPPAKVKRRVAPLRIQTEQNELSMEQMKLSKNKDDPRVSVVPLIKEQQKIPQDFQDIQIEKASQKHVVATGPQELPPQPQKEEVVESQDKSSGAYSQSDEWQEIGGRGK